MADGGGEGMLAALHAATSKGRVEQARALLQANPLLATTRDAQGWTPGLLAAYYDQPEVLEMCLTKGARAGDVDADTYRASALHWAAGHGRVGVVLALVKQHGADPNLKDAEGQTALHRACRNDQPLVVLALLLVGADPSVETVDGERPAQGTDSKIARGFLRMAEGACWPSAAAAGAAGTGQRRRPWRAGGRPKGKQEQEDDGATEAASSVAMGAVYGRGYQSGYGRERGASPSTRSSTGSSSLSGGSEEEEEEEGADEMLLVLGHDGEEEEEGEEDENEEALLLLGSGRRARRRSTGRYRIVV